MTAIGRAQRRAPARARRARGRAARRRAGELPALRADPRLAGRPRRRPGHAAGDPGGGAAPVLPALARAGRRGCSTAATRATRSPSTGSSTAAPGAPHPLARGCAPVPGRRGGGVPRARRGGDRRLPGRRPARAEQAGVPPRGFVAPGYAYTRALRDQLAERFDWWATLLRRHGRACTRPRSGSGPRAASSARPRRCWCARARRPRGGCCGWTCTRPTSITRATCTRSRPCCSAPSGASRSPTTTSAEAVLRANWREGVRRDGTASRSPVRRRGATSTSGTGTRAFTRSPGRTSIRRGRGRSCGRCCARGAPTGSSRTRRSGRRRRAGAARRCTRPPVRWATTATRSIQTPLLAVAWERAGARRSGLRRRGARAAGRARATGWRASATRTGTGC